MSSVCNVFLMTGSGELWGGEGEKRLDAVNEYFKGRDAGHEQHAQPGLQLFPRGSEGGGKHLEAGVAVAAINYLNIEGFIAHLKSLKWRSPSEVQLVIKDQHDDKFRIVDLFEAG